MITTINKLRCFLKIAKFIADYFILVSGREICGIYQMVGCINLCLSWCWFHYSSLLKNQVPFFPSFSFMWLITVKIALNLTFVLLQLCVDWLYMIIRFQVLSEAVSKLGLTLSQRALPHRLGFQTWEFLVRRAVFYQSLKCYLICLCAQSWDWLYQKYTIRCKRIQL